MPEDRTEAMLDVLIMREGGYVNNSADKGGATKYGITLATLAEWRNAPCTVEDVMALPKAEAREIYRVMYFEHHRLGDFPSLLQPLLLDMLVNHGSANAWRMAQRAYNNLHGDVLAVDGIAGAVTRRALMALSGETRELYRRNLLELRRAFYLRIAARNPSQTVFLKGWFNRLKDFG